jgi:hypothetical protein
MMVWNQLERLVQAGKLVESLSVEKSEISRGTPPLVLFVFSIVETCRRFGPAGARVRGFGVAGTDQLRRPARGRTHAPRLARPIFWSCLIKIRLNPIRWRY